jgi:hypothetical protein
MTNLGMGGRIEAIFAMKRFPLAFGSVSMTMVLWSLYIPFDVVGTGARS